MTQNWVTFLVALLTAVTGLAGAIGGQLVASGRAVKLAQLERQVRAEERNHQARRAAYARFLVAARLVEPAAKTSDPVASEAALAALREAAAYVELAGPSEVAGEASAVLDAAGRWVVAAGREGPLSPGAATAMDTFQAVLLELRTRMQAELEA